MNSRISPIFVKFFMYNEWRKNIPTHAHGIKIAIPIYDTVFKHLMENKRIARFFIETLINEKVTEIAVIPRIQGNPPNLLEKCQASLSNNILLTTMRLYRPTNIR